MELKDINLVEDGYVAVIDKPLEWTSADVVRKIKFALRRKGYRKLRGHREQFTQVLVKSVVA